MKRVALVIVAAAAVAIAWAARRPAIAPAPPRARALPLPAVRTASRVCWLELGAQRALGATASGLLVRVQSPEVDVVIDTGDSTHFGEELAGKRWGAKLWLELLPGAMQPSRPANELVAAAGADPARLGAIFLTHGHVDHAGGLRDLPGVPVRVPDAELGFLRDLRDEGGIAVIPAQADEVARRFQPLRFEARAYEVFDESADLFGDGSLVAVPLPGHTPGSTGFFVALPDGRRVFLAGDAINARDEAVQLRGKALHLRATDHDPAEAGRTVARLAQLAALAPDVLVLPAHERAAWQAVFGSEPRCLER